MIMRWRIFIPVRAVEVIPDKLFIQTQFEPDITIFACERSASLAFDQIKGSQKYNNIRLKTVPCVCRIGENIILKTLERGSKKIIVAQ